MIDTYKCDPTLDEFCDSCGERLVDCRCDDLDEDEGEEDGFCD